MNAEMEDLQELRKKAIEQFGKEGWKKAYNEVLMMRSLKEIVEKGYSIFPVTIHTVEELVTLRLYLEDLEKGLNDSRPG